MFKCSLFTWGKWGLLSVLRSHSSCRGWCYSQVCWSQNLYSGQHLWPSGQNLSLFCTPRVNTEVTAVFSSTTLVHSGEHSAEDQMNAEETSRCWVESGMWLTISSLILLSSAADEGYLPSSCDQTFHLPTYWVFFSCFLNLNILSFSHHHFQSLTHVLGPRPVTSVFLPDLAPVVTHPGWTFKLPTEKLK